MNYNLHTHTGRSDGSGNDEEYVLRAIEKGFVTLGFSDHAPLKFNDGFEAGFRVPLQQAKAYVEDIKALKKCYEHRIDILVGFELEYYPEYFDKTLSEMVEWGVEYLVLGQHFVDPEHPETPRSRHVIRGSTSEELLSDYVDRIVQAMETEKFTYVAHPDMFLFSGDKKVYQKQMRKICVAAKKLDIPLEINLLGIRGKRCYPNTTFWELAAEENAPVTLGADAHAPMDVYDPCAVEVANGMVKRYGLNYVGKAAVKKLQISNEQ